MRRQRHPRRRSIGYLAALGVPELDDDPFWRSSRVIFRCRGAAPGRARRALADHGLYHAGPAGQRRGTLVRARALLPTMLLLGSGFALCFATLNIEATTAVGDHEHGLASGLVQTSLPGWRRRRSGRRQRHRHQPSRRIDGPQRAAERLPDGARPRHRRRDRRRNAPDPDKIDVHDRPRGWTLSTRATPRPEPELSPTPAISIQLPTIEPPHLHCLLTRERAAEVLSVSTDTIDRLVRASKLAIVRVGGQVRFKPDDLEAFIDRNRCGGDV
jgi:excisionase family DNA binding protein